MINHRHKNIFCICSLIISMILYSEFVNSADDSTKAGDSHRGAKAWADNCARCHNYRDAKEIRDDLWPPVVQHMRVRAGLTGQETRDIIVFLQSSNYSVVLPVAATAGSASSSGLTGAQIFKQTCAACHGTDGKGVIPGVPDLRSRLSKSDDTLLFSITNGLQSPGSAMAMPPKGGNPDLTPGDIEEVLEYIRAEFK